MDNCYMCNSNQRGCCASDNRYECPTKVSCESQMTACPCRQGVMGRTVPTRYAECNHLKNDELAGMPLAMAYVPWQYWNQVYGPDCALEAGTIFPELVKPFVATRCYRG